MSCENLSHRNIFRILPIELIHEIFSYLNIEDLKMLRLTSHKAFDAARYIFLKTVYIRIDDSSQLDDISCLLKTGIETVKIKSFNFQTLKDHQHMLLSRFLIDFCVDLEFSGCNIEQEDLFELLDQMLHLKSLTLISMLQAYNIINLMVKMITRLENLHVTQHEPTYKVPKNKPIMLDCVRSTVRDLRLSYRDKFFYMLYEIPTILIFHELAQSVSVLHLQFDEFTLYVTNWFSLFRFDLEVLRICITEQVRVHAIKNLVEIVSGYSTDTARSFILDEERLGAKRLAMKKLKLFQIVNQYTLGTEIIFGEKTLGGLDIRNIPNLEVFHFSPGLEVELDTLEFSEWNSTNITNLQLACNFSDHTILSIVSHFKNLTHLHLQREFPILPAYILGLIFENMPNLEMLNVQSCDGIRSHSCSIPDVTIKHLQKLRSITLHHFGRAEEIQLPLLREISTLEKVCYVDCGVVTKGDIEDLLRTRPAIKHLHVTGHSLSIAEVKELMEIFQNTTIELLEANL